MPSTIIVGGQYGSEGKGKVTALLAQQAEAPFVVRCGGPNAGHTVNVGNEAIVLRQVPSCPTHPRATLLIAAGCVVDQTILLRELDLLQIPQDRIIVDPRAVLVSDQDRNHERASLAHISSTFSGTGAALVRRISRSHDVQLVKDSAAIRNRCTVALVAGILHETLAGGGDVFIEGSQGFGLSLLHSPHYPYVTSRDTSAAGVAMEAGLSPRHVDNIVMVLRTFPIRVGGPSGPLPNEITWEEVQRISGAPEVTPEFTSVTKKLRRVAKFDIEAVKLACHYNAPTSLAIMGLDRLDYANSKVLEFGKLTSSVMDFVNFVERETAAPVTLLGTGFATYDAINSRGTKEKREPLYANS